MPPFSDKALPRRKMGGEPRFDNAFQNGKQVFTVLESLLEIDYGYCSLVELSLENNNMSKDMGKHVMFQVIKNSWLCFLPLGGNHHIGHDHVQVVEEKLSQNRRQRMELHFREQRHALQKKRQQQEHHQRKAQQLSELTSPRTQAAAAAVVVAPPPSTVRATATAHMMASPTDGDEVGALTTTSATPGQREEEEAAGSTAAATTRRAFTRGAAAAATMQRPPMSVPRCSSHDAAPRQTMTTSAPPPMLRQSTDGSTCTHAVVAVVARSDALVLDLDLDLDLDDLRGSQPGISSADSKLWDASTLKRGGEHHHHHLPVPTQRIETDPHAALVTATAVPFRSVATVTATTVAEDDLFPLLSPPSPPPDVVRPILCVMFSSPLAMQDRSGNYRAIPAIRHEVEREYITQGLQEASRGIEVQFEIATTDKLRNVVTLGCRAIHFSG